MLVFCLYRKLLPGLRRANVTVQCLDDSLCEQVYGLSRGRRNVTLVFRRYQMVAHFIGGAAGLATELNIFLERVSPKTLSDVGGDR